MRTSLTASDLPDNLFGVRSAIEAAPFVNGHGEPFSVTASFGVAAHRATAISDPSVFFHQADQALYHAKEGGRNRVSTV